MATIGKVKKVRKYKKVSCHTTITAAKAKAKSMRAAGETASVRKGKSGACVFSAGKSKGVFGRKRTTAARKRK